MPRATQGELARIIARQGYGIESELRGKGYGVESAIGTKSVGAKAGDSGAVHDVESNLGDAPLGSEALQIKCSGKVRVRVKFYRHRLADYSRAISEKALVDCLQYAGLIRGDSEKEIRLIDDGQEKVATKEEERTEITLEYPEVDLSDLWEQRKRKDGR